MITAAEALGLPSAQLSPEEVAGADALEAAIDTHTRLAMKRGGVAYDTQETRGAVLAETAFRLRQAGWQVQLVALQTASPLAPQKQTLVGYKFVLVPGDDARAGAERSDARGVLASA